MPPSTELIALNAIIVRRGTYHPTCVRIKVFRNQTSIQSIKWFCGDCAQEVDLKLKKNSSGY